MDRDAAVDHVVDYFAVAQASAVRQEASSGRTSTMMGRLKRTFIGPSPAQDVWKY